MIKRKNDTPNTVAKAQFFLPEDVREKVAIFQCKICYQWLAV